MNDYIYVYCDLLDFKVYPHLLSIDLVEFNQWSILLNIIELLQKSILLSWVLTSSVFKSKAAEISCKYVGKEFKKNSNIFGHINKQKTGKVLWFSVFVWVDF